MRILHFCALILLVAAAAYVYEIKFESTLRAERVAKMRVDVRRERDAIAALRAEWATLDNPARIQSLSRRHLQLRPAEATQFDALQGLPDKPPSLVSPEAADAIAVIIENPDITRTGSVPAKPKKKLEPKTEQKPEQKTDQKAEQR